MTEIDYNDCIRGLERRHRHLLWGQRLLGAVVGALFVWLIFWSTYWLWGI